MYNSAFLSLLIPRGGSMGGAFYIYNSATDENEHYADEIVDGYFNQANIDNPGTLEIGDILTVCAVDGYGNFNISAINPDIILNPR